MDDLRLHAVVARVVAWHNSHPLARRITAAQVNSVGYVALPYTAPGLPPPVPLAPPAPPPSLLPLPEPPPAEPVDIDPFIETDDPGAIVIDVDPEPQAAVVTAVDFDAMTLEVELPAATLDDAPRGGLPAGAEPTPEAGPQVDQGPSAADPAAPVATPPAAQPVSSLRARAAAGEGDPVADMAPGSAPAPLSALPAPGAPRTLVCSEDFIAPLPTEQVLDWVRQHGLALQRAPTDGPVHQVPVDTALLPPGAGVAQLWVATAAIEVGGQRHRLLLGGGEVPAVLGRRAWSRPRLLGALAAPGVMAAAAVWWMWPAAPAASAAALPTVAVAVAAAAASAASAAPAPEASASAAAVDAERHDMGTRRPLLPGLLDDDAKARARVTVAALRAERAASAPTIPAAPQAAAPTTVLYGLSTRLLRTRAEAEQLQSAFQALLGGTPGTSLRVEMLPVGEDWRVVCWPYAKRADAERARELLQARGLRVELVDF